jgi:ribosomal protein S18 acetylase RimI-like enzyme
LPDLTFRRYGADGARAIRDTIGLTHRDAYADEIASGNPFYSHEAFMQRFDAYCARPTSEVVVACIGSEPVGQTWGWPLDTPEPGVTDEGKSTFALSEIMLRQAWKRQGVARALHDELLSARPEEQADLYVRPDNAIAYRAYLR